MLVPAAQFTGRGNAVQPVHSRGPSTSSSREDLSDAKKGKSKAHIKQPYSSNFDEKDNINLKDEHFEAIMDRAQLDAGKEALRQLLKERKTKKKSKTSWLSLLKLYVTIVAGLMIIGGLFTLLFLVPMTIDPALATLTYEFHPTPVLCMTTFAEVVVGLKNITWCSCTEGCTSDVYNCSQITVVYRNCVVKGDSRAGLASSLQDECDVGVNSTLPEPGAHNATTYIDNNYWDNLNASLFINVKGCGYPPVVNCSNFFKYYGVPGRRFLCYYSEVDRSLVMPQYNPQEAELELLKSLGWTVGAQVGGIVIIIILHCPYLKKCSRRRSALQPQSGNANTTTSSSTANLVTPWRDKDKPRQPVFQRDWYDVHT
ncbi:protein tipE-like [Panulirus ornatus]|uniref:protein tipE-like n=1 Tax=Panulirus ornatus TaxID=150431 RepID=UPI003A83F448